MGVVFFPFCVCVCVFATVVVVLLTICGRNAIGCWRIDIYVQSLHSLFNLYFQLDIVPHTFENLNRGCERSTKKKNTRLLL